MCIIADNPASLLNKQQKAREAAPSFPDAQGVKVKTGHARGCLISSTLITIRLAAATKRRSPK